MSWFVADNFIIYIQIQNNIKCTYLFSRFFPVLAGYLIICLSIIILFDLYKMINIQLDQYYIYN